MPSTLIPTERIYQQPDNNRLQEEDSQIYSLVVNTAKPFLYQLHDSVASCCFGVGYGLFKECHRGVLASLLNIIVIGTMIQFFIIKKYVCNLRLNCTSVDRIFSLSNPTLPRVVLLIRKAKQNQSAAFHYHYFPPCLQGRLTIKSMIAFCSI